MDAAHSSRNEICILVCAGASLQYIVMPFSVVKAPATSQRYVNLILSGLKRLSASLTWMTSWSVQHPGTTTLNSCGVFDRLCDGELTLNLAKCEIRPSYCDVLGIVLGRGQVKADLAKT